MTDSSVATMQRLSSAEKSRMSVNKFVRRLRSMTVALAIIVFLDAIAPTFGNAYELSTSRGEAPSSKNMTMVLANMFTNYDKRIRPDFGGRPVDVEVSLVVKDISLSDERMEFSIDLILTQEWNDSRLAKFQAYKEINNILLNSDFKDLIWSPDTFFANERKARVHTNTMPNEIIEVKRCGRVTRKVRMTIIADCPIDMSYYPKDSQHCYLKIGSFSHFMSEIIYRWKAGRDNVCISILTQQQQFELKGYMLQEKNITVFQENYSIITFEVLFLRLIGTFLIQTWTPCTLIAILSWITFWISRNQIAARIALSLNAALALMIVIISSRGPKVSYTKSIDYFYICCYLELFGTLFEVLLVHRLENIIKKRKQMLRAAQVELADHMTATVIRYFERKEKSIQKVWGMSPADVDKYSRIIWPLMFIAFRCMFAIYCYSTPDGVTDDLILYEPSENLCLLKK